MSVVRLDDDDLDDEDRAILAEVRKKGYYHGRPKSQVCPPPARIEAPAPVAAAIAELPAGGRAQYDEFQRKWDRFDRDDYLDELEAKIAVESQGKARNGDTAVNGIRLRPPLGPAQLGKQRPAVAEFKVLLAGDGCVGKTALLKRHLTGEFAARYAPTQQPEIQQLRFSTNCGDIAFNVWDLASSSKHWQAGCVRQNSYNQGQCAIIMIDVTSRMSYRSLPNWYREITKACGCIPIVIVANKVDVQERQLKSTHITFHRKKEGLQYYELSVRDNLNVEKPFLWLARRLANQPELCFVGPAADIRREPLDVQLFAEHARRLEEALSTPLGDEVISL